MPGHNCRESLLGLVDDLLESSLSFEESLRGMSAPKLREALEVVTWELSSWGLDSPVSFKHAAAVPLLCHEILAELQPDWKLRLGLTVEDVYREIFPEYHNLLKILSHRPDADLPRAKKFCLALSQIGMAQWRSSRRGLAA